MPRGTLWAIYAILQFINRIIVTLHFFVGSKLFYFSEFSNFWLQNVNQRGRFSVGRYCQKLAKLQPGARGGTLPPRPVASMDDKWCDQNCENLWRTQSTIESISPGRTPFAVFEYLQKKPKFHQKWPKSEKKTKIVKIKSYSQGRLC